MKNLKTKLAVTFAAVTASSAVFAVDHSLAINAAFADGNTNLTAGIVGLIALMAVIVGVGALISIFKKG